MRALLSTSTAAVLAAALSTGLYAQQRPTTTPSVEDEAHKTVTLTGCLEASASLPGFRLKNIEPAAKPGESAVGTSGKPLVYEVSAREGVDLAAFAGQKVTVTAVPEEKIAAEPKAAPEAAGLEGPLPKITVATVKTVAGSC
jgi:hypothetical protein